MNAVPNAMTLADKLADTMLELFNNGLDVKKLHVVGHSLGKNETILINNN